jgi:hypothetical protein
LLHRRGSRAVRLELGRQLAALIPGARLVVPEGRMQPIYAENAEAAAAAMTGLIHEQTGRPDPTADGRPQARPPGLAAVNHAAAASTRNRSTTQAMRRSPRMW